MHQLSRRRFLTITAAAATVAPLCGGGGTTYQWRGVALGADASITLAHPDADRIIALALAEIARLEAVFSLQQAGSALVRLNRSGHLAAPPFELLECLGQCARLHAATQGRFDPTIQPLWALYAAHFAGGDQRAGPHAAALAETLRLVGFDRVHHDASAVTLAPGMALSLNGIAQGYIADRVADLLHAQGLRDVLVNTGEFRAIGGDPRGGAWQVGLRAGKDLLPDRVDLADAALASSSAQGVTFDLAGRMAHILDPQTGLPATARWKLVSVKAQRAWLADGLSTAFCLMEEDAIRHCLRQFPQAGLSALVPAKA
jgi:FAD:protein FMN transferase